MEKLELLNINEQDVKFSPASLEMDLSKQLVAVRELSELVASQEFEEENLKEAKEVIKNVRAKAKEVKEVRQDIEKKLVPVDVSDKIEDLKNIEKSLLAGARAFADKVKEFEDAQADARILLYKERFASWVEVVAEELNEPVIAQELTYNAIRSDKDGNKGYKMKDFEKTLEEWKEKLNSDIKIIQMFPNAELVMSYYLTHYDLKEATDSAEKHEKAQRLVEAEPVSVPGVEEEFVLDIEEINSEEAIKESTPDFVTRISEMEDTITALEKEKADFVAKIDEQIEIIRDRIDMEIEQNQI